MRRIININENWKFVKQECSLDEAIKDSGEIVNIPHTFNAIDGCDGGSDYYRGDTHYIKEFSLSLEKDEHLQPLTYRFLL